MKGGRPVGPTAAAAPVASSPSFTDPAQWPNPYTNVMWIRIAYARQMQWVFDAVDASGCIFSNRWGDLPLWGATVRLQGHASPLALAYEHRSHKMYVGFGHPCFFGLLTCSGRLAANGTRTHDSRSTRLTPGAFSWGRLAAWMRGCP